jgi:hypothetical protein
MKYVSCQNGRPTNISVKLTEIKILTNLGVLVMVKDLAFEKQRNISTIRKLSNGLKFGAPCGYCSPNHKVTYFEGIQDYTRRCIRLEREVDHPQVLSCSQRCIWWFSYSVLWGRVLSQRKGFSPQLRLSSPKVEMYETVATFLICFAFMVMLLGTTQNNSLIFLTSQI